MIFMSRGSSRCKLGPEIFALIFYSRFGTFFITTPNLCLPNVISLVVVRYSSVPSELAHWRYRQTLSRDSILRDFKLQRVFLEMEEIMRVPGPKTPPNFPPRLRGNLF